MEIKGKVKQVLDVQRGTSKAGNEWSKATVIVEYGEGQYPKEVAITNMKHADEFARLAVGTEVTFQVDVTSREFNGRWYTACEAWKWDAAAQSAPVQSATAPVQSAPLPDGDPLPF